MTAPMTREELLALAARLVVASDILKRKPCEVVYLQQDCLLAAEALRGVAQQPWQPIETAPKDGTSVLAIRREWWEPVNGNHRWVFGRVYETYFDDKTDRFESHGLKQPTHWRPLPAPPSNQGASK